MTGLRVSRRLRAEHRCEEVILSKQELPGGVVVLLLGLFGIKVKNFGVKGLQALRFRAFALM